MRYVDSCWETIWRHPRAKWVPHVHRSGQHLSTSMVVRARDRSIPRQNPIFLKHGPIGHESRASLHEIIQYRLTNLTPTSIDSNKVHNYPILKKVVVPLIWPAHYTHTCIVLVMHSSHIPSFHFFIESLDLYDSSAFHFFCIYVLQLYFVHSLYILFISSYHLCWHMCFSF